MVSYDNVACVYYPVGSPRLTFPHYSSSACVHLVATSAHDNQYLGLSNTSEMKFLKKLRSRSHGKEQSNVVDIARNVPPYQAPPWTDLINKLPPPILERIFGFVCPHTQDETYESCEQSAIEDACMLCDLRDLAHCTKVSRRWRKLAANVL